MNSLMDVIGPGRPELYAPAVENIALFYFVYTLNIHNYYQSGPNKIIMYMTIRSEYYYRCNTKESNEVTCP